MLRSLSRSLLLYLWASTTAIADACDFFCHLGQANKASLVMLIEEGLVPGALGAEIAAAIERVIAEQDRPGAARSSNYLDFEARLVEISGPEASRLHTGRSRQDLHGTVRRMLARDRILEVYAAQLAARAALLDLAAAQIETVIPAYTHGVPAQPTSLAHYLLAFAAALERDGERLEQAYRRLNQCPLGAAALATSGFPLNRHRLAELLGFDGPLENSYDANLISSADFKLDSGSALALSAIPIGQFAQDLHAQYRDPAPWLLLDEAVTDSSSIMPQKRNPRPLDRLRSHASAVIAGAHAIVLAAHNTNTGMHDYRRLEPWLELTDAALAMYRTHADVVARLRVGPERALEELGQGYSTMTEVADTLQREAGVPFRTAHHYASELTRHGRAAGKRPAELTDAELSGVYRDTTGTELPVAAAVLRAAMDPIQMVRSRRGHGGPQPDEVRRMLDDKRESLRLARERLQRLQSQLEQAAERLERAFAAVAD